jgi:uncharacterized protein YyaL (SSP411 family)
VGRFLHCTGASRPDLTEPIMHAPRRITRILPALLVLALGCAAGEQGKDKPRHTNRLAKETSPYLLMHAHNPTDWYPWGPEAFEKARKEGKLVFLSIGYSSCYWCHVMERESFNNEAVAKILNDGFVCIKVDREERPDIDQVYMTALQTFGRSGGWPLSMFLLPDGRPILGGTYWPAEDRKEGDEVFPGFKTILARVLEAYKERPDALEKQAADLAARTKFALANAGPPGLAVVNLDRALLAGVVEELKEEFDPQYGGFGSPERKFKGPKFPTPCRLDFLLGQGVRAKDDQLTGMVRLTLDRMAQGGIYDQVGGGFHRYSTERTWTVPHFEKMLYDNAQLVELYARACRATNDASYRRVVEETLAYVEREMTSPEGAFYSSQDAETHHEEGRFYVWTDAELAEALPDKADRRLVQEVYAADQPNFEEKYHILRLAAPLPDLARERKLTEAELRQKLDPLRKRLFEARARRDRPFLNKIALTAWSGLMIAGYAEAGRALQEPRYTRAAAKAADFILGHQKTPDGRLLRTYGAAPGQKPKAAVTAYQEDYADLVHGLLNLHDATGEKRWLDEARALTDTMIRLYGDEKGGGYYFTAADHDKLFARGKDQYDGAQPSGNSVAARNLVRLWALTGEEKYQKEAERTFRTFAGTMKSYGPRLVTMASALDLYLEAKEKK